MKKIGPDDFILLYGADEFLKRCQNPLKIFSQKQTGPSLDKLDPDCPYAEYNGKTALVKIDKDGVPKYTPLANFIAWIDVEERRDDGVEGKVTFALKGRNQNGQEFPPIQITAEAFGPMLWPLSHWGGGAIVTAGQSSRDNLRAAIQYFSKNRKIVTIYTHTGWRRLDEWIFLHAGGAISAGGNREDIIVDLSEGRLGDFLLPVPPQGEELKAAVRNSLGLVHIGTPSIGYASLSAIGRAPLGEALALDFTVFFEGSSGTLKTATATLIQQHAGLKFHAKNLPASWSSTANSNEKTAALAKDNLLVIDDFVPGNVSERDSDRTFRGQGNQNGRLRMRADGTLRPPYCPRALPIVTGEGLPKGQSKLARIYAVPFSPGDINLEQLTRLQALGNAGEFAKTYSGYLKWLAPHIDQLKKELPTRHQELRGLATTSQMHKRTPDTQASLGIGLEVFLRFALEVEAITAEEREKLWGDGWAAIGQTAQTQKANQDDEDHAQQFIKLIDTALILGKAHLEDATTGNEPKEESEQWGWRKGFAQGEKIGWVSVDEVWLNPGAAYNLAQRLATAEQNPIPIGLRTLLKRLADQNLLIAEKNKNVNKREAEEKRRTVLVFSKNLFSSAPEAPKAPVKNGNDGVAKWNERVEAVFNSEDCNTNNTENGGGAVR